MKHQQGSTLIIVLVVLLLITIVGTIAMRGSMLNLRLSTSGQISNILIESSDAAIFNLQDPGKVTTRLTAQQMYGHFDSAGNADDELVFCYLRNESAMYAANRSSIIGSSKLGVRGYCKANSFATGRDAVVSQVYLRKLTGISSTGNTLDDLTEGSSIGASNNYANMKTMAATVVSIMPTFAEARAADIEACFKHTAISTVANNVTACFRELNVPYNVQYAEYQVGTSLENSALKASTAGSTSNATNP